MEISAQHTEEFGKNSVHPLESFYTANAIGDLPRNAALENGSSGDAHLAIQPNGYKEHHNALGSQLCREKAREYSRDEFERIAARLKLPVPMSETASRPGPAGSRVHYIEGWKVINEANHLFGFNGWSLRVLSTEVRSVEEVGMGRCTASVSVHARVTLRDGTVREDRGGGVCEHARSKGEAIIKAEKEAVTDATKRALKNFGNRLGLCLYNRAYTRGGYEKPGSGASVPMQTMNTLGFQTQAMNKRV